MPTDLESTRDDDWTGSFTKGYVDVERWCEDGWCIVILSAYGRQEGIRATSPERRVTVSMLT